MTQRNGHPKTKKTLTVRCAIYTRKSTEEGLEQEFNSLDAQRDAGEAFIASQQHEGWVCLPDHYDDGGFTGANMDRPALLRLMTDIEAGRVDCVVVYKVDRLSRSLLDFARMMETFEKQNISFVSVTQQFNTATSMGRLILNVLLSFAQFEREMISERTRDKIAAARRKGKWSGGMPVLGYDVVNTKLFVNKEEGECVRAVFRIYLELGSLLPAVQELERRGWRNKAWTTSKGTVRGGQPFNRNSLYNLLTNVTYLGRIRYKGEVYHGEHDAIVPEDLFNEVQQLLRQNRRNGGADVRNRYGAILKGILRCTSCGCSMGHTFTSKGIRRYRYYVCLNAQKRGHDRCPTKSIPASEIERIVVEQIKAIGSDPTVVAETLVQARRQAETRIEELEREQAILTRQLNHDHAQIRKLATAAPDDHVSARLADLQERVRTTERRVTDAHAEVASLQRELVDEKEVIAALAAFDPVWESLTIREQARVIQLLIECVEYDSVNETVTVTFQPSGLRALAKHPAFSKRDNAA